MICLSRRARWRAVSCCLHGIDLTGIRPGDTVLVIGGGPIGQLMLQLARLAGAATLILVEPVAEKRELALNLGADIAIDPFKEKVEEILARYKVHHVDATIENAWGPVRCSMRSGTRGEGAQQCFWTDRPSLRDSADAIRPLQARGHG